MGILHRDQISTFEECRPGPDGVTEARIEIEDAVAAGVSMPQGGLEALETKDPLDILAYQYDIVCNGIELSSGAIRNHRPEIMYKAFEIAGYPREQVETEFAGMLNALKYGAPPHGGSAPGIDRIADSPAPTELTSGVSN